MGFFLRHGKPGKLGNPGNVMDFFFSLSTKKFLEILHYLLLRQKFLYLKNILI